MSNVLRWNVEKIQTVVAQSDVIEASKNVPLFVLQILVHKELGVKQSGTKKFVVAFHHFRVMVMLTVPHVSKIIKTYTALSIYNPKLYVSSNCYSRS
jgi:hypothetical protein